jgi:type III secretion system FlhB-like substrate exporter
MKSTHKIQKAVALFYDGKNSPTVSAKGTGAVADNIIAIAEQHGVPLCDNVITVRWLNYSSLWSWAMKYPKPCTLQLPI